MNDYKSSTLPPEMRRVEICNLLRKNESALSIGKLAEFFSTSEMTIRRDIERLEED